MISVYDGYIFLTEKMNERLNKKNKPYVVVEGMVDQAVLEIPNTVENKYPEAVCMMAGLLEDIFGVSALLKAFMKTDKANARLLFYGKGSAVSEINACAEKDPRIKYCGELTNQQIVAEEKKATLLINPRPAEGEWTAYSFPSKIWSIWHPERHLLRMTCRASPENTFLIFIRLQMKIRWDSSCRSFCARNPKSYTALV